MPYPFAPGEVLTATNLNAALNQRMMADGTGLAFVPGAILFGATTGKFATDSVNLTYDDTNNRLGIQTSTPQAMLQVGKTAATARSYNQYTDTANGAWAYLGDWSKTAGVATYGSDKNGSGIVADVSFVRGGTEMLRLTANGVTATSGVAYTQLLPVSLGTAALVSGARGCAVVGNYAYVASGSTTGLVDNLEIFDITVSTAPVKIGGIAFPNQALGNVIVAGQIAYCGINAATGSVQIIDVSNPKLPVRLSQITTANGTQSLALSGAYLYVGMAGTAFRIYDVSDPSLPILKSTLVLSAANGTVGIALQGDYLFIGITQAVGGAGGLYVYDVSDIANPVLQSNYTTAGGSSRGIIAAGKYLYMCCFGAATGLETIDISDPTAPQFVKSTAMLSTGVSCPPVITGRYLYLANGGGGTSGIQIYDIIDPANPVSIGSIATTTAVGGIAISGNRLYNTANNQLQIWNTLGIDVPTLKAGSLNTDRLYVDGPSYFDGDMYAQRGLVVGQAGIFSRGPIVTDASEAAIPISANFGLGLVCIGGSSSAFPALKRSGVAIQVRLGDDSALTGLEAQSLSLGGAGAGSLINPLDIRRDFDGLTTTTLTNASTGVGAQARAIYSNDASTGQLMLGVMGTLATTNGLFFQDGAYISAEAGLAGGLNLMTRAAAPIRFATNGQANERMQITSAGLITFGGITTAFPALKRNAAALEVRLADDSAYGNITAAWVGINGQVATVPLDMRGTFTSATEAIYFNMSGTLRSATTFYSWGAWFGTTINPTAATVSLAAGIGVSNILAGSAGIYNASAVWIRSDITTYAGTTPAYMDGISMSDTVGLSATKYAYQHTGIRIVAVTNGHGSNFNGIANIGLQVDGPTSGPAVGGVIHNRCLSLNIPTGSGAGTTNNFGIYIGGNGGSGGGGATTNYSILSDSTALSVIASLRIGNTTGSGNATNATAPMLYITAVAGQPTATPLYSASGAVAIQFDVTNKKLWAFDTATNTWKGVVLA